LLKQSSSQELLGYFQPHLVGNVLEGWGFIFVQIKGLAALFGAQLEAK